MCIVYTDGSSALYYSLLCQCRDCCLKHLGHTFCPLLHANMRSRMKSRSHHFHCPAIPNQSMLHRPTRPACNARMWITNRLLVLVCCQQSPRTFNTAPIRAGDLCNMHLVCGKILARKKNLTKSEHFHGSPKLAPDSFGQLHPTARADAHYPLISPIHLLSTTPL